MTNTRDVDKGIFVPKMDGTQNLLVIGIGKYNNFEDEDELPSSTKDAQEIFKVLEKNFLINGYKKCLSGRVLKTDIEAELKVLSKKIKSDDTLVIYYSGHGDKNNKKESFWQTSEAEKPFDSTWLAHSWFRDKLEEIAARHILVVSDSCFTGGLVGKAKWANDDVVPEGQEAFKKLYHSKSCMALMSGDWSKVDAEYRDSGRSRFSLKFEEILLKDQNIFPYYQVSKYFSDFKTQVDDKTRADQYVGYDSFDIEGRNQGGEALIFRRDYEKIIDIPIEALTGFRSLFEGYDEGIISNLKSENQSWYSWSDHHAKTPDRPSHLYDFDEEKLLTRILEKPTPVILTGQGGVGKTRFALELGKAASQLGWFVFRVTELTRGEHFKNLRHLQKQYNRPILIILDYVEALTEKFTFNELVSQVETLNRSGTPCRLLSTCRKTYWDNPKAHPKKLSLCEEVMLSSPQRGAVADWLRSWQRGTYAHITNREYQNLIDAKYVAFFGVLEKFLGGQRLSANRRKVADNIVQKISDTLNDLELLNSGDLLFQVTKLLMCFSWKKENAAHLENQDKDILKAIDRLGFSYVSDGNSEIFIGHDLICDLCFERLVMRDYDEISEHLNNFANFAVQSNQLNVFSLSVQRNLRYLRLYIFKNFNQNLPLHLQDGFNLNSEIRDIIAACSVDDRALAMEVIKRLPYSISLTQIEKIRVAHALPRLNRNKLNELLDIFDEEQEKFELLREEYIDEVRKSSGKDITPSMGPAIKRIDDFNEAMIAFSKTPIDYSLDSNAQAELVNLMQKLKKIIPLCHSREQELASEVCDIFLYSLSLSIDEKWNVLESICRLSSEQLTELLEIFNQEQVKFAEIADEFTVETINSNFFFRAFAGVHELAIDGFDKISSSDEAKAALSVLQRHPFVLPKDSPENKNIIKLINQNILEVNPTHINTLGNYARLMEQEGNVERAIELYERAIKAAPDHAHILGNYARLMEQEGNVERAIELYERAIKAAPDHAHILGNYARLMKQEGNVERAIELYERAIKAAPDHAHILGNYALLMKQEGNVERAEELYEWAIKAAPDHANTLGNYALLMKQEGNVERAIELYERAIKAAPDHAHILGNYALLMEQEGNVERAEELYERAIKAAPDHAHILGNYVKLLFLLGKRKKGLRLLRKAENLAQEDELKLELAFYRYAHVRPFPIKPIKELVLSEQRCLDWPLNVNVQIAIQEDHPNPKLLEAIVRVISGGEPRETLEKFQQWVVA